jgi:acyl-coenzyme A thioesterase PaaI-like protein
MVVSEKTLKWVLCLYPPLLFQRIWIRRFHPGFRGVDVKINKSLFNKNYNGSIFGGTIYAATDPFYAILFDQILQRQGFKVRVWLKSAAIQYLKPGRDNLYFTIVITDEMLNHAIEALNTTGKFVMAYPVEIYNVAGELCATVTNEVYIRNLHQGEIPRIAY